MLCHSGVLISTFHMYTCSGKSHSFCMFCTTATKCHLLQLSYLPKCNCFICHKQPSVICSTCDSQTNYPNSLAKTSKVLQLCLIHLGAAMITKKNLQRFYMCFPTEIAGTGLHYKQAILIFKLYSIK